MFSRLMDAPLLTGPTIEGAMGRGLPARLRRVPGTVGCPGCGGRISGNKGLCRECDLKWQAYKGWTHQLERVVKENGLRKKDGCSPEALLPLPSPPSLPEGLEKMVNKAARSMGVGVGIPPSL